jgi:hypothetical protein
VLTLQEAGYDIRSPSPTPEHEVSISKAIPSMPLFSPDDKPARSMLTTAHKIPDTMKTLVLVYLVAENLRYWTPQSLHHEPCYRKQHKANISHMTQQVNKAVLNSTSQTTKRRPSSTQWVLKTSHSFYAITLTISIPSLQLYTMLLFHKHYIKQILG